MCWHVQNAAAPRSKKWNWREPMNNKPKLPIEYQILITLLLLVICAAVVMTKK